MNSEKKSKRQERREKQMRQARNSRLFTIGLIVAGAALVLLVIVLPQIGRSFEPSPTPAEVVAVDPGTHPNAKDNSMGDPNAPITIEEFSDFQCPFCKAVVPTVQQVMTQYAGKVRWVFRDFPIVSLHPLAPKAHEAARCAAEQGKFWEYHDLLFANQRALTRPDLESYAEQLGLDMFAPDYEPPHGESWPVFHARVDHAVDGIAASAPYADHFDLGIVARVFVKADADVGIVFFHIHHR